MGTKGNAILEGLNSEQVAAVSCVDGPVLIVAGAGSGKTRVLTSRIAYILAEKECDPARILALTFTKKAASEMKERIAVMVGEKRARRLYMGTFHSVFIIQIARFDRTSANQYILAKKFITYPSKIISWSRTRMQLFTFWYQINLIIHMKMYMRYTIMAKKLILYLLRRIFYILSKTNSQIHITRVTNSICYKMDKILIKVIATSTSHGAGYTLTLLVEQIGIKLHTFCHHRS